MRCGWAFHNEAMNSPHLIAIYGPTAVGKTQAAVGLARRLRAEGLEPLAVSADAFAVYKELPILSGAPDGETTRELEHAMVGVISVRESYSVGTYAPAAHAVIDAALANGRPVIVVGGTGLYLQAATREMSLSPQVEDEVRQRVSAQMDADGPEALHQKLGAIDPQAAQRIDPADARRIGRALELIEAGFAPVAPSQGMWDATPRHRTLFIALTRDRSELRERIARRTAAMVAAGAGAEALHVREVGPSVTASKAIGYQEMLDGDPDRMETRTWQYAKRQMTWLRRSRWDEVLEIGGMDTDSVGQELRQLLDAAPAHDESLD